MSAFGERGKPEFPGKNLPEKSGEPTYRVQHGGGSGNRAQAILLEGECSHHCTNPCF